MDKPAFHQLIGDTPLIDISYLSQNAEVKIFAKCEFLNPGLSFKDRMAAYIIGDLEKHENLKPGDTLVCASSGNTGTSIAMIAALKGYNVIVVTNEKCSTEKRTHIRALGAELIIVDNGRNHMEVASEVADSNGYYNVDQYNNPLNPESYYHTLAPEIWEDVNGELSHFVMTGSTYGCITGVSRYLKERNNNIMTILADPQGSNIYNCFKNSEAEICENEPLNIEGAGKEKPTDCLDFSLIDDVIKINNEKAFATCQRFAKESGLIIGGSSGLNLTATIDISGNCPTHSVIVTILCDSGIKYLSTIYK